MDSVTNIYDKSKMSDEVGEGKLRDKSNKSQGITRSMYGIVMMRRMIGRNIMRMRRFMFGS